jgi:hypothetical protein
MKLLNLIIYNETEHYKKMKKLLFKYLLKCNIDFYFITYKNDINEKYIIDNNEHMLYIKGNESMLPGILEKTLFAFELFKDKYDYIIRSNMSTIINFKLLEQYLILNSIKYGGSNIYCRHWIDPNAGIYDDKYFGIDFICGTGIIISNEYINYLLNNIADVDRKIMDDISIGVFFHKHNIKPIVIGEINYSGIYNKNTYFYRNKNIDNRNNDIIAMQNIISKINNV